MTADGNREWWAGGTIVYILNLIDIKWMQSYFMIAVIPKKGVYLPR
jgi:hypothetical protein